MEVKIEQLPKPLQNIIIEAKEAIINHPNGELILPLRKKIWMELGVLQENHIPTIGARRRTMLEVFSIERLIYLWKEILPNDNRPEIIIENIKKYFIGEVSREELKKMYNSALCCKEDSVKWKGQYSDYDFWVACENYIYHDNKNHLRYYIGFCACKIKQLALCDTDLSHTERLDLDYDFYDSYVSYDISQILAPFTWENTSNETLEQRRKYWLWYINEAVPEVFKSY